jgi:hypothetical protein
MSVTSVLNQMDPNLILFKYWSVGLIYWKTHIWSGAQISRLLLVERLKTAPILKFWVLQ